MAPLAPQPWRPGPPSHRLPFRAGSRLAWRGTTPGEGEGSVTGKTTQHRLTAIARALPPLAFERRAVRGGLPPPRAGRSQRGREAVAGTGGLIPPPLPSPHFAPRRAEPRGEAGRSAVPVEWAGGRASGTAGGGQRARRPSRTKRWGGPRPGWGRPPVGRRLRGARASPASVRLSALSAARGAPAMAGPAVVASRARREESGRGALPGGGRARGLAFPEP